ncbi:hypothetical protein JCGZ_07649 [Jatropha curcas]|uniref:Transmembrane protein n=1 Tax=Jatropha curcas TaxID=180498 RepID=A0A067KGE0_JATCU|nr:hypothetical protein JCGZ_07649 [Jatropha curcas]
MGRTIPLADDSNLPLSIYQTLSFSFLLAGMAAVIAISTTLCGIGFGRKTEEKESDSSSHKKEEENLDSNISKASSEKQEDETTVSEDGKENDIEKIELPLPPAKQLRGTYSCNNFMTKSASTRNLGKNTSMRMPRSMSMARRDREVKKKAKVKADDSVWMKTIILGEKCKVRREEEDDSMGKNISTYHPESVNSRQNSSPDINATPSQEKGVARKEEEELS